jgi:FKBP-type peptidyl-prolyl cis-trans isomerase FklB
MKKTVTSVFGMLLFIVSICYAGDKPTPAEYKSMLLDKRMAKEANKEKYIGEGREFLAENAKKEGVVTLPSGLQYRVVKSGSGRTPGPQSTVTVNYRGTLIDGTEFGGSGYTPDTFRVDGVISGWEQALQLMKEGDRWTLFVPADLAYGERGPLADRTVIFDIELISVE